MRPGHWPASGLSVLEGVAHVLAPAQRCASKPTCHQLAFSVGPDIKNFLVLRSQPATRLECQPPDAAAAPSERIRSAHSFALAM